MTEMLFDTQRAVDRLVDAGIPLPQARAHAAVLAEVLDSVNAHFDERYATKEDLALAVEELKLEMATNRTEMMRWVLTVVVAASFIQSSLIVALILKLLP
jgi:hypothetical protein